MMQFPEELRRFVVQVCGGPVPIVGWHNMPGHIGWNGCVIVQEGNETPADIVAFAIETSEEVAQRRLEEVITAIDRRLEEYEDRRVNIRHAARDRHFTFIPQTGTTPPAWQAYCQILVMVPNGTFAKLSPLTL